MVDEARLRYSEDGGIAFVTLADPHSGNRWDTGLRSAFHDAMKRAHGSRSARVILLSSAASDFCVGADRATVVAAANSGKRPRGEVMLQSLLGPKPVVGAIRGSCTGIGLVLALLCDVRLASADAHFCASFSRIGMIAEHGTAWLLARTIGLSASMDMLLSGRDVDAAEALRLGLVSQISQPATLDAEATAYAQVLAERVSPRATALIRRQVFAALETDLGRAVETSNDLMTTSFASGEVQNSIAALESGEHPSFVNGQPGISELPAFSLSGLLDQTGA